MLLHDCVLFAIQLIRISLIIIGCEDASGFPGSLRKDLLAYAESSAFLGAEKIASRSLWIVVKRRFFPHLIRIALFVGSFCSIIMTNPPQNPAHRLHEASVPIPVYPPQRCILPEKPDHLFL